MPSIACKLRRGSISIQLLPSQQAAVLSILSDVALPALAVGSSILQLCFPAKQTLNLIGHIAARAERRAVSDPAGISRASRPQSCDVTMTYVSVQLSSNYGPVAKILTT